PEWISTDVVSSVVGWRTWWVGWPRSSGTAGMAGLSGPEVPVLRRSRIMPARRPGCERKPRCARGLRASLSGMATWEDVARLGAQLPGTELVVKRETRSWGVKGKAYAWERPLRKTDLDALGDAAPDGDVLAVRVPDAGAKEALLAEEPGVFFTTPHFD